MRTIGLATVAVAAFAVALTLGVSPRPATAGKVCDDLDLNDHCVNSSDLKARLNLDEDGKDGRLRVRDAVGANAVQLNAADGSVTNRFSNAPDESNGLVKAWAQINADGTVAACWRCDLIETTRLGTGRYEVDFTPLGPDITGRPRSATIDDLVEGNEPPSFIDLADRIGDASSVFVQTADVDGTDADRAFILLIY
jgi:hypothetical protein